MTPKNSFTFLRLLLAMMVLFGHSYVIGGFGTDPISRWSIAQTSCQELGVKGFFILSGFLLMHSLTRNPSLVRFTIRRFFRIFPAFWMTLILTSFAVAPVLLRLLAHGGPGYFGSILSGEESAAGYFFKNALLYIGQMEINPATTTDHVPLVINGSLWSLFYEAGCYVGLGLASWAGLVRKRWAVVAILGLLYLPSLIYFVHPFQLLSNTTPIKLVMNLALSPSGPCVVLAFAAGAAAYVVTGGKLPWNPKHFLLALLAFALVLTYGGVSLAWPFLLPYILLSLAGRLPFQGLDRVGDVSYGVYLYAALIQHCLVLFGVHQMGFPVYTGCTIILSIACGAASWFLIEKPAISLGQRVVARSGRLGGLSAASAKM